MYKRVKTIVKHEKTRLNDEISCGFIVWINKYV